MAYPRRVFTIQNPQSQQSAAGHSAWSVVLTDACPGQPGFSVCKDNDVKIWNVQHYEIVKRYPTSPSGPLDTTLEILFPLIVALSFWLYVSIIFGI